MKKYNIALIGATGLVGRTFLKVLEEYESRYGIMGMGMSPYMNNMNYGAPINNSYMPTQPMQQPIQPTQPINQNYQAPTDNNGQNNNF